MFVRAISTAVAIALVVLAMMSVFEKSYFTSYSPALTAKVVAYVFHYLPWTLELVVVSFFVASVLGFASCLRPFRRARSVTIGVALVLQSIPFFVLALAIEGLGVYTRLPIGGTGATFADNLAHLILPVGALALFQLPPMVEFFNSRPESEMRLPALGPIILGGLAAHFARNLPDLITATIVTEVVFAWRGDGWLFWGLLSHAYPYQLVGLLFVMALFVLVKRLGAEIVTRRTAHAPGNHV